MRGAVMVYFDQFRRYILFPDFSVLLGIELKSSEKLSVGLIVGQAMVKY